MATQTTGAILQRVSLGEDIFLGNPTSAHVLTLPGAGVVGDGAAVVAMSQGQERRPAHQEWRIEQVDGNCLKVVSVKTGLVLTVAEGSQANGAPIIQKAWQNADNQKWDLGDASGDGEIVLSARHSKKVIDLAFNSPGEAAAIIQWDYHGGPNQRWIPTPVR